MTDVIGLRRSDLTTVRPRPTPVVPDHGGQREHALQDPHSNTGDGASAVLFEVELAFEDLIDRLDALPHRAQQAATGRTAATTAPITSSDTCAQPPQRTTPTASAACT